MLFDAPTIRKPTKESTCRHLQNESKKATHIILWLDCDREGENICFEVLQNVLPNLTKNNRGQKLVYRARFSAVTQEAIDNAMRTLTDPNKNESDSVEARQVSTVLLDEVREVRDGAGLCQPGIRRAVALAGD